jgi:uncharacterized HhH-GPD family protein
MILHITGEADADRLLTEDPLALLIGMLLDQQVPMETAFAGPLKIAERAGTLDAAALAHLNPDEFAQMFKETPAVHRFPGSMAARVQALCAKVEKEWGGDAAAIWTQGGPDGAEVLSRLRKLPGFGEQKAKIFLALLGARPPPRTANRTRTAAWRTSSRPNHSRRCASTSAPRRRLRRPRPPEAGLYCCPSAAAVAWRGLSGLSSECRRE